MAVAASLWVRIPLALGLSGLYEKGAVLRPMAAALSMWGIAAKTDRQICGGFARLHALPVY
ncbi:MAG: hypothetical protein ACKVOJ_09335 [Sphingomonadaceae bacterium]